MADSYQVLKGKYEMALSSIRELEQERDIANHKISKMQEERAKQDKSTKYLCETILKKEKEKKGEVPWFKLDLPDMIDEAQRSIENYFPSIQKMCEKLIKHNGERTETIAKLNRDIEKMQETHKKELAEQASYKDKIISELKDKLKTGKLEDEEIETVVSSVKMPKMESIDMDASGASMEIVEEESDDFSDAVYAAAYSFENTQEVKVPVKQGPPVKNSPKTKEATKNVVKKVVEKTTEDTEAATIKLNDMQKMTIRIMGETGAASASDMKTLAEKKYPDDPMKSRITNGLTGLIRHDKSAKDGWPGNLVEAIKCSIPGTPNFCVYRLTDLGKNVYRYRFGKEPVKSEVNLIIKNHTSIEHGYGIKNTAILLKNAKYIKKMDADVVYMTRAKEYTVKTGENSSYIPDIVIVYKGKNGQEYREYYEYETAKCQGKDFFAKCNKMASFTRFINIIVPGKPEKEIILKELEEWKEKCLEGEYPLKWERPVEGRVLTYNELKSQNDVNDIRQVDWTRVTVSRPRKGKEKKS